MSDGGKYRQVTGGEENPDYSSIRERTRLQRLAYSIPSVQDSIHQNNVNTPGVAENFPPGQFVHPVAPEMRTETPTHVSRGLVFTFICMYVCMYVCIYIERECV
jgi:hypothetical protein